VAALARHADIRRVPALSPRGARASYLALAQKEVPSGLAASGAGRQPALPPGSTSPLLCSVSIRYHLRLHDRTSEDRSLTCEL
jgi:hypothetical protein